MKDVYIEYCNLPMLTALQNEELEKQIKALVRDNESEFSRIRNSGHTFRQIVCLHQGEGLPSDLCEKILEEMDKQDKIHPYPITKMYPFLGEDSWILYMKDVSYMKVDLCYGEKRYFDIEKIAMQQGSSQKSMALCFYPYDIERASDISLEETDGEVYFRAELDDRNKLLNMMKCILLNGTLDLGKFE